jgi:hypothetical protein
MLDYVSTSSSITKYDDDMSQHSGSTMYRSDISKDTDLRRSRGESSIHTSNTYDIRKEYFKLLEKSRARYSQAHVRYNATTVRYGRTGPRQHTLTSYASPHTAITNAYSVKSNSTLPFKDSLNPTSSSLNKYGVHHYKVVRTIQTIARPDNDDRQGVIVHEDHIYEWTARYLGLGFRMRRRKPYGSILPSISTYPVISEFDDFTWDLIYAGTVTDIQSAFATRKLHPFLQNERGEDLYNVSKHLVEVRKGQHEGSQNYTLWCTITHCLPITTYTIFWNPSYQRVLLTTHPSKIALLARRLDICQLLYSYGARPSLANRTSHLEQLTQACEYLATSDVTSLLDFVFSSLDPYSNDDIVWPKMQHLTTWPRETLLWLWHHASAYGLDMITLNEFCLRMTLRHLAQCPPHERSAVQKLLLRFLTPTLINRILNRELVFLDDLFAPFGADPFHLDILEENARDIGAVWLAALAHCDIDILDYLTHEIDAHPNRILVDYMPEDSAAWETDERQIVWTYSEDEGYSVSFQDVETSSDPLVVQNFDPLVCISEVGEWPFARAESPRGETSLPGSWVD